MDVVPNIIKSDRKLAMPINFMYSTMPAELKCCETSQSIAKLNNGFAACARAINISRFSLEVSNKFSVNPIQGSVSLDYSRIYYPAAGVYFQ